MHKSRKILFLISNMVNRGGTQRVTCELANAFAASGHSVHVLCLFGESTTQFELHASVVLRGLSLSEVQARPHQWIKISRHVNSELRAQSADFVILVDTILFAFCFPYCLLRRSKLICWEHFNLRNNNGTRARSFARWAASRWGDQIVVLTERDAIAWRARYSIKYRVRCIENPVTSFAHSTLRSEVKSEIVLAVGRLTEQKGFHVLLDAWHMVGAMRGRWKLKIIGTGEEEESLRRQAKQLGIAASVIFAGDCREIAPQYSGSSIFVMSSRSEGLPMTLLEAQYFGLPCVSTDCETGPREILTSNSGFLVPVDDSRALADAIARLIKDPDLRRTMSSAALANSETYGAARLKRKWESMFDELLVGANQ